jgi:hypothetical protein
MISRPLYHRGTSKNLNQLPIRLTTRFGLFLANLSPAEVSVWPLNSKKGDGETVACPAG